MREIKFRVWNAKDHWYFPKGEEPSLKGCGEFDCELGFFDCLVIEQFTGLYDIKNKPIYENDILLNEDCGECYQVKWDDENACFYWDQDYFMGDNLNCMIVIGNINQNSQILSKTS